MTGGKWWYSFDLRQLPFVKREEGRSIAFVFGFRVSTS